MIKRQQTQLKNFFYERKDPTFVIDDEGELVLANPAANDLFRLVGSE